MKKTAFLIMIATILSKLLGFGREIVLSYFYGASTITDAYLISLTIPGVIFSLIGAGIGTGYIPMYSRIKHSQGSRAADRFTNNLSTVIVVMCTIIIIAGLVLTEPLVRIFASGFSGETLNLTIRFTRISMLAIYFTGLIGIYSGYLRLNETYLVPNLVGIPMNIIIIVSLIASSRTSIYVLLIGSLLARCAELGFLLPFVCRKGYQFQPIVDLKDKNLRAMVSIAFPVILGTSINQVNKLVDRTIASRIAVGGISALNYANRLTSFVQSLFVISISSVMYPMISKMASEGNVKGLKSSLSEALGIVHLMVMPITVGAIIFAEPIVSLLFGRGAFTAGASLMTSSALQFYSLGMLAFGQREILVRAFYALQDTRTPMINAAVAVAVNIVLNIALSRYMGISGLALATSIAGIFGTILLVFTLRRKVGSFGLRELLLSLAKSLLASLVMGFLARVVYDALVITVGSTLSLVLAILGGGLSYFAVIYVLRVPEMDYVFTVVRKRLQKAIAAKSRAATRDQ